MRAKPYLWAIVERVAPMAVSFAISVIVARMVAPAAYGLVAMLGLFMAMGQAFTELGLGAALVQRREIDADDETTVFIINIVAGLAITAALCAISPLVALFMHREVLTTLLCVQSFGIAIASMGLVQFAIITRRMDFRSGAVIELIGTLVSGVVAIAMARAGYDVWSLVGLSLSREIVRTIAAWLLVGWRPSGRFSVTRARAMWAYSSQLLYSSIFHRLVTNLYSVLMGRFYAPAALGIYTRAISLQSLPGGLVVGVVQRVAFPLFARHQDDKPSLLRMLRRQICLVSLAISAVMGGLAVIASDLVPWLLGPRWGATIPLLEILCASGVLSCLFPLHSLTTMALGESSIFFKVEVLKKLVILAVLAIVYRYGLVAFAWGAVATSIFDYGLSALPTTRLLGYTWRMQISDIAPAVLLCALPALILLHVPWFSSSGALFAMSTKGLLFASFVCAGVWLFRVTWFMDVWDVVRLRRIQ